MKTLNRDEIAQVGGADFCTDLGNQFALGSAAFGIAAGVTYAAPAISAGFALGAVAFGAFSAAAFAASSAGFSGCGGNRVVTYYQLS